MTHTVSVLVENRPGALARVSNMFARRGFNIESLAVGPTERHDVSRIVLTVDCPVDLLEQIGRRRRETQREQPPQRDGGSLGGGRRDTRAHGRGARVSLTQLA